MSLEILKEVTDWGEENIPNSTYYVDASGSLVAHETASGKFKVLNKPIRSFSKSRRKFELLGHCDNNFKPIEVKTVVGSKGNKYTIIDGKCSCPGFTFRGTCKHTKE